MKRAFLVGVLALVTADMGCGGSDSDPSKGSTGGSDGGIAGTGGGGTSGDGGASGSGGEGTGGAAGAAQPDTLAADLSSVVAVGTDGTNIYWLEGTTDASIRSCPVTGCGTSDPSVKVAGLMNPQGLIVSGTTLAWAAKPTSGNWSYEVARCSLPECSSTTVLFRSVDYFVHFGADAASVFWTQNGQGSGKVLRSSLSGAEFSGSQVFSSNESVGAVATNGQSLYWVGSGSINACSAQGSCDPTIIASGLSDPSAVAATAENVYWMSRDGLFSCPTSGCGMAPSKLADGPSTVNPPSMGERIWAEMQASGGTLYWLWRYADSDSGIYRCSETDCATTLTALAKEETTRSMALDAGFVYWVRYTINDSMMGTPGPGTILRIAR